MDNFAKTDTLVALRTELAKTIASVQSYEGKYTPPVVQEVVLARRALEDARMRLGVALTLEQGFDPLGTK